MKHSRWYEIKDGMLHIYESGYADASPSVSIVSMESLPYYRKNFRLRRVWSSQ